MDSPLFWELECESDQAKYSFDQEGSVSFRSELLLWYWYYQVLSQ
jgi:hypothetical protein